MSNGIVERALSSLGRGFDLTSDFRLKFCKGEERLVQLNETEKRTLVIPGFGPVHNVPADIRCDKGDRSRYQSDILEFSKMSEFFNQKSAVPGKIPSGMFNSMFGFHSNCWANDAAEIKYLGLDGYFIVLFNLHIDRYPLVLSDEVCDAVPSTWDPSALARFIEKYGTHVIVGLGVGGQDAVVVRQDRSSNMAPSDLKKHLDDLGDQLFTGACPFAPFHSKTKESKHNKTPQAFNLFDPQAITAFDGLPTCSSQDGITVISSKRGGDPTAESHCEWLLTVPSMPDAIHFSFIPITSLLKGVPGSGFLSHAINLYLRYKPPLPDLQSFLEFQTHKLWAPIHNDQPLGPTTNRATSSPSLSFSLMGPKLYVNTSQVIVGKRPVTGMRFFLEGMKCNKLAIHLQHLASTPSMLEGLVDDTPMWQGSEDAAAGDAYFEGIQGKRFSHVCVAPIEYVPTDSTSKKVAYIVTGAQLQVKKHDSKNVLHLRLRFSKVSNSFVAQSNWDRGSKYSQKSGLLSAISTSLTGNIAAKEKRVAIHMDSSVYPTGPPVPVQTQKLLKFVDTSQHCKGPQDSPGHWLVTGAKLDLEKGKICVHVKFSLLNLTTGI
ncbi:MACPF domain-containing protein At1g14780 [Rhodamnia argentea]|uniref:MACPF domain-containing protein At1g14780 n=1 Tax=Rhodamnia argentea TaxID=178133 RepID=A0ABM3HFT0_9MYRT|nr:MACPF domain-containing protein At1g14780 [Rhodamnia argentea]XP_048135433.1 MACPF domain-containing protein At1g14780 [Rhodamnia argentea]